MEARPAPKAEPAERVNSPERTGAPGADMLNDLVDQIEKDLVRPPTASDLPDYSSTAGCWFDEADTLQDRR